ncbi:hypothetical protein ACO0LO_18200 [Undibacterium sp. TJN25]|uniref:hypothetical protein n=1 Tax=Undibacterium sp. TJN25 TaxID=3413056 RepID=UPI003BF34FB3
MPTHIANKSADVVEVRRRSILCLLVATAGTALLPTLATASTEAGNNLMPQFWKAYDLAGAGDSTGNDRAQALLDGFFLPQQELMSGAGVKVSLKQVAGWLKKFDPMADDVRALSATVPSAYARQLERFCAALPDFDSAAAPVYFMPSLFQFDGHLQPWKGVLPLFVGLDGIVYYHGAQADLTVLLNHEMFHLYQGQKNPAMMLDPAPPIYVNLWMEGVATYMSQLLTPGATRLHVLLDDAHLAAAGPAMMRTIATDLLQHLDSNSDADMERFFSIGYHGDIPARGGYLIGLAIAERAGKNMTPAQMGALPASEIRGIVMEQLKAIAGGISLFLRGP